MVIPGITIEVSNVLTAKSATWKRTQGDKSPPFREAAGSLRTERVTRVNIAVNLYSNIKPASQGSLELKTNRARPSKLIIL